MQEAAHRAEQRVASKSEEHFTGDCSAGPVSQIDLQLCEAYRTQFKVDLMEASALII